MLAVEWPLSRATLGPSSSSSTAAVAAAWHELDALKQRVPDAIARLGGRHPWERLVHPPAAPRGAVSSLPVASRAYHKLSEIAQTCALHPTVRRSLHLCEAPGGFVQATGDHLAHPDGWTWLAVSRPWDLEEASPAPQWSLLPLSQGQFVGCCVEDWTPPTDEWAHSCDLVTADGAFDADHSTLEHGHLDLLWSQTRVALACLAPRRGCLVIKFFEGALAETREWMAWVTLHFESVSLIKPKSSRATNSERYLVARRFVGRDDDDDDAPRGVPSEAWTRETLGILERMAAEQGAALRHALTLADSKPRTKKL